MKLINLVRFVSLAVLIGICTISTYAQKKIKPVEKALTSKPVKVAISVPEYPVHFAQVVANAEKNPARKAELETKTIQALERFVAQHLRLPRTQIRSLRGTLNRVEDMTLPQLAEFKLARQIEFIQARDPNSNAAQTIQAIKEQLSESTSK